MHKDEEAKKPERGTAERQKGKAVADQACGGTMKQEENVELWHTAKRGLGDLAHKDEVQQTCKGTRHL